MARAYNKTKRASKEQQTHDGILDAAYALYCDVGPATTSISAVAKKASVQRLTVYRHFPAETDLLNGVLDLWSSDHPLPVPADWRDDIAPENWPIAILSMVYSYFEETAHLWPSLLADRNRMAGLDDRLAPFDRAFATMQADILSALPDARQKSPLCRAAVSHAAQFTTWKSLRDSGLETVEIAALMEDWIWKCPLG